MQKEKQVKRTQKYSTNFLDVYEDDVTLPNGKPSKRVVVKHIGAAAVLPITKEGKFILIKQHRYAAGIDAIEMPAGKKDSPDEEALACVKRELIEETAHTATEFEYLTTIHSAIGFSDETIALYLARDVVPYDGKVEKDEEEFIERMMVDENEALRLLKQGAISDAKTVVALLMYFNKRGVRL